MERVTILLILLFIILFIGQAYTREYFVTTVDISNSTLTMSLTDLLYTIGSERRVPDSSAPIYPMYPIPPAQSDVEEYLLMKEELLNGMKLGLKSSLPRLITHSNSSSPADSSASCTQGAAYKETVALCGT